MLNAIEPNKPYYINTHLIRADVFYYHLLNSTLVLTNYLAPLT